MLVICVNNQHASHGAILTTEEYSVNVPTVDMVEVVSLPANSFFIGKIVGIFSEERFLTEGKPNVKKVNQQCLTTDFGLLESVKAKHGMQEVFCVINKNRNKSNYNRFLSVPRAEIISLKAVKYSRK
jgi:flavin reductase (DIM6/NTAB) family NADH-FMN oxidoreductase RutF